MDERAKWWNLWVAPVFEAGLIVLVGLAGWLVHRPLLFASLGPTAYELVESPDRPSARPYNVLAGHAIGIASAFFALWLTGAWHVAAVSAAGVPLRRVFATGLAALLTVLLTTLAKATQPAAVSTTLLISAGAMQRGWDGVLILLSVCLLTAAGEPVRRWRMRLRQRAVKGSAAVS